LDGRRLEDGSARILPELSYIAVASRVRQVATHARIEFRLAIFKCRSKSNRKRNVAAPGVGKVQLGWGFAFLKVDCEYSAVIRGNSREMLAAHLQCPYQCSDWWLSRQAYADSEASVRDLSTIAHIGTRRPGQLVGEKHCMDVYRGKHRVLQIKRGYLSSTRKWRWHAVPHRD
jgi:hypothetical protein